MTCPGCGTVHHVVGQISFKIEIKPKVVMTMQDMANFAAQIQTYVKSRIQHTYGKHHKVSYIG